MLLRVGSRGSRLALTQAELACEQLRGPGIEIALVPITTAGDRDRTKPFGQIGERGVFVKELEEALLDGRIDVAVHSAKDMTSTDTEGLVVGAYLPREDPRDALCGADEVRPGMRIGTASVRRRAQLLVLEPSLSIEPMRGNIDTRLRKRRERGLDAVVLAACGLDRLGLADEIGHRFDPDEMLPEAGQGALALQVRAGEEELVVEASDAETARRVELERAVVAAIGGGCLAPIAAHHDGRVLDGPHSRSRRGLDRTPDRRRSPSACCRVGCARRVKVVVTRPRDQAGPLVKRLEELGHDVVECPLVEIEPLPGAVEVEGYDWVIVTSPNGARELVERASGDLPKVAAVGPGTAETLRELGVEPAFVPRVSSQDGLLAEFPRPAGRVLFAAAQGARRRPIEELDADFVALYTTELVTPVDPPEGDLVVLASASAAKSFAKLGVDIPAVTIGPQTSDAARAAGLHVLAEAETHDLDGLVGAVNRLASV